MLGTAKGRDCGEKDQNLSKTRKWELSRAVDTLKIQMCKKLKHISGIFE